MGRVKKIESKQKAERLGSLVAKRVVQWLQSVQAGFRVPFPHVNVPKAGMLARPSTLFDRPGEVIVLLSSGSVPCVGDADELAESGRGGMPAPCGLKEGEPFEGGRGYTGTGGLATPFDRACCCACAKATATAGELENGGPERREEAGKPLAPGSEEGECSPDRAPFAMAACICAINTAELTCKKSQVAQKEKK